MTSDHILWGFLGLVGGLLVLAVYKKLTTPYVTENDCLSRRRDCTVCKDVTDIRERQEVIATVLFGVAAHLQVPPDKYKDLVSEKKLFMHRRKDD